MKTAEAIAIVGMGCRFPGDANDPTSYWELLINGVDAISEVPEDRWNLRTHFSEDKAKPGKTYTRCGGFIKDIDKFDADFFGISPREAACMDPQQRILLEITWEALADAGIAPEQLAGTSVGTFMGIFTHDYNNMQLDTSNRDLIDTHTGVGVSMSIVANRISYAFDFTGPSVTLDTACSSSLVALHLACQSIRNGECDSAIAGGANAILKPEFTIATSKASMLSPDGRCKSFDASANGYVRSEGAGVVILKPLSAAQRDGDSIYAIIKSSVVNQDGKSNGLTVPNQKSQKAALRKALELADVAAEEILYVEAHGTGTFVGDPIEANSIGAVFGENRTTDLIMGSVKSNIGHLEAASGMASLIKVVMSLKNEMIPPNIHFKTPNPQIEFDKYHLRVPVAPEAWAAVPNAPRHACINSFGFGGTNATVILAESPQIQSARHEMTGTRTSPFILPLSANSPKALDAVVGRIQHHLETSPDSLSDLCFSAATRSGHRDQRLAFIASDKNKMLDLAAQFLEGKDSPFIVKGSTRYTGGKLAFVFSGMGTQWWGMGRQLIEENALFRETIETCDRLLSQHANWSLLEELSRSESDTRINITQFAQPAIFAVEVALAKVWQFYGMVPDAVCGHSVGEVAAAHVSGALSLEDAIKVIFYRSQLQQKTAGMGGMLAVSMSRDSATQLIEKYSDRVSIAAVNSPTSVTLAGELDALGVLEKQLNADNIFCRPLKVEVPFHCVVMDIIKDELISSLQSITPKETVIPLYSTVTGNIISGTQLDADYWWHNVREPVEFAKTINAMEGCDVFLEVGPHPVLTQSMNECLSARKNTLVLGSIKRQQNETATLFSTLGSLYTEGYPVKWANIVQGQFVKLPMYPWQRLPHWRESEISIQDRTGNMTKRTLLLEEAHPLLGNKIKLAQADSIWEAEIQHENLSFLKGHIIHDAVVFPGAGFIEMALAATLKEGRTTLTIEHFSFEKALVLTEDAVRMQSVLSQNTFSIYSEKITPGDTGRWVKHASVNISNQHPITNETPAFDLAAIRQRCTSSKSKEDVYETFATMGFNYQGDFCGITHFQCSETEALAQIELGSQPDQIYTVYPPLLDNGFQVLLGIASCVNGAPLQNRVFLPVQIAKITVHHRSNTVGTGVWCHALITESNEQGLKGNLTLYDNNGKPIITIEELFCVSVEKTKWDTLLQHEHDSTFHWFNQVRWLPLTSEPEAYTVSPRQWLILGDNAGHGGQLASKLSEQGHSPFLVSAGTEFLQCSDSEFQISAERPRDYQELLKCVKDAGNLGGIVYLWPLDILPLGQSSDSTCGCGTLLYLIQALNNLNLEIPLWIVTKGGQFIVPEAPRLEQSPVWGFAQVISLEQPQLQCRCIDLDPEAETADNTSFLLQALNSDTQEYRLAFRDKKSYVARLVPSPFSIDKSINGSSLISAEATYLITGAFGGLGRLIAQRLIANGARHLVLMGRRGATGNEDFVADLNRLGVTPYIAIADVSVREDVERVINDIKKTMPPLRGIIHAAGVLDDGVITQQSPERFEKIMKPKVQGSWNLHELTLELPLDLFVCFSSVASLVGSPGQSNYAAGNAFMDLLAHARHSIGLPALSINWGPWAGEGMAAAQLKRLESKGFGAIDIESGLQAFEQLIGESNSAQIGVAPINWELFFSAFPEHKKTPFFSKFIEKSMAEESGHNDFLKQLKETIEAEQHQFLLKYIEEIVNSVFGYSSSESANRQKSLFDNGLDSLMALEIKNRLESSLRMPLQSTLLFEHPTIDLLGDFLSQQMGLSVGNESPPDKEVDDILNHLDTLTDEELSALLENELSDIIGD